MDPRTQLLWPLTGALGTLQSKQETPAIRSVSQMLPYAAHTVDPLLSLTRHAARQYGVSTFQLALVNEATIDENCDNLSPNQNVCLGFTGEDCTKVYTVVANEYVYSLGLLGDFSLEDPDCYGCRGGTGHSSER